jgi:hypothetical protein
MLKYVQSCGANALKKNVVYMGIKLDNKLPNKIRKVEKNEAV